MFIQRPFKLSRFTKVFGLRIPELLDSVKPIYGQEGEQDVSWDPQTLQRPPVGLDPLRHSAPGERGRIRCSNFHHNTAIIHLGPTRQQATFTQYTKRRRPSAYGRI